MSKGSDLTLGGKLIDLFAQNVFGLRVLLTHWISSNVLPAYRNGISRIKCCSPQSMVLDKKGAGSTFKLVEARGQIIQEFSSLSGLFLFLGVWLCFNRVQEKPHL